MNSFFDKTESLTPAARGILCDKDTERAHAGIYCDVTVLGTYLCRRCGKALFRANNQFSSRCGWPSFDDELAHTVKQCEDADGRRTEILCARCDGHLGHIFLGEGYTQKNRRYCVNSASIDFVADSAVLDTEEVIVAGGCFWGVDYHLRRVPGVLKVEVGYTGGHVVNPLYQQVCEGDTGHFEAVRVVYDVAKTSSEDVLRWFFEIHDPCDQQGQGPDRGEQYRSAVFYYNTLQREQAEALMRELKATGFDVATRLLPVQIFWPADEAHQNYYDKHSKQPYCHHVVHRFKRK